MSPTGSRRCGFTLVELLVVIAIIAILAALVFPTVNASLARARLATCLSHQGQIYLAMVAFAADHNRRLPWAITQEADRGYLPQEPRPWLQDELIPYCGGDIGDPSVLFRCPSVRADWLANNPVANHYRYNALHAAGRPLSQISSPSEAIVLFDVAWPDWPLNDLPHDGIAAVFADGHTDRIDKSVLLDGASFAGDLDSELMRAGW